jgi:hypothetical protein
VAGVYDLSSKWSFVRPDDYPRSLMTNHIPIVALSEGPWKVSPRLYAAILASVFVRYPSGAFISSLANIMFASNSWCEAYQSFVIALQIWLLVKWRVNGECLGVVNCRYQVPEIQLKSWVAHAYLSLQTEDYDFFALQGRPHIRITYEYNKCHLKYKVQTGHRTRNSLLLGEGSDH